MKDFYRILGVDRTASAEEIKRAYRRLASQHHPDKGGDTSQFQEIEEAYRVLGDPQQRQLYDNPRAQFGGMNFGTAGFDLDQLFAMFGHGQRQNVRVPRLDIWITLRDVLEGGSRTVALQINKTVENVSIDIPQGLADGDTIRYPGLAPGGHDLIITFRVRPQPGWSVEGNNITTEIEVDVFDLILGSDVLFRDLRGRELSLSIPAGTQPGSLLRMRGQGLPPSSLPGRAGGRPGDMLLRVRPRMPTAYSEDFLAAVRRERGH